jgi:hypothetical protein
VAQRHGIAGLDGRIGSGTHFVAGLYALGRENVATLAIGVLHQCDVPGAIRIVFDRLDNTGHAVLVATEVDDAVLLLRATALVPRGDAAGVVARARVALGNGQRRMRLALVQVRPVNLDYEPRARRRRLEFDQCH